MDNPPRNKPRQSLEAELGEQLNALLSAAHALNVRSAAQFDSSLQPAAFHLVRWLYSYGPTNAATLAASTAMDRSSVTRLVKQLQALDYVTREVSPKDGREILLTLTETGQQRMKHALAEKESAYYERLSSWTDTELNEFIRMLRHFNGFSKR
ncbi:MarR family winged helix-turn-helix transcriptional regulator [Paenibacillus sp. NFR01]|uniref:MarR family winged helix-turn-helix transcriptional regulator n=1 Tax=Paenibacillus sp. NFR01 TaxID=1566279 RepID=UPI0008BA8F6C|nr:MarR family transcriptional regulator [Paenibacillus sp. NFR01]SET24565.1 DNA-binding transcriptional regulator, MarR family [Paenibacillus sp. NFR01]